MQTLCGKARCYPLERRMADAIQEKLLMSLQELRVGRNARWDVRLPENERQFLQELPLAYCVGNIRQIGQPLPDRGRAVPPDLGIVPGTCDNDGKFSRSTKQGFIEDYRARTHLPSRLATEIYKWAPDGRNQEKEEA